MLPLLKDKNIKAKFLVRDINKAKEKYPDLNESKTSNNITRTL